MNEHHTLLNRPGRPYWRSLEQLAETDNFKALVEREFPNHAFEMLNGSNRRQFLKVMAASLGLAGLTAGCRWPKEKIVPYASRPENRLPGVPTQYATAMELGGSATGLLVTSYDGRPIKIEGNPSHPASQGATSAIAQASVLDLYDPDRSQYPIQRQNGQPVSRTWNDVDTWLKTHFESIKQNQGKGFYVLSETSSSPSLQDMRRRLSEAFPLSQWHEFESLSPDNELEGTFLACGQKLRVRSHFNQAQIILSLDSDFAGTHPAAVEHARDFTQGRKPIPEEMNRLYVVESAYSLTGAMADHRLPIPSSDIELFLFSIAAELIVNRSLNKYSDLKEILQPYLDHPFDKTWLSALADDLTENQGRSLITAGYRQPLAVHALAAILNDLLGNTGKTVEFIPESNRPAHLESIRSLAEALSKGEVETLLILGGNPAIDAPVDLGFGDLIAKANSSIHLSLYNNETSLRCEWHLPRAHYLEAWGDARSYDGTILPVQPLIQPLYEGKTPIELLASIAQDESTRGYDIVRRTLMNLLNPSDFESAWRKWLNDGVIENTRDQTISPSFATQKLQTVIQQRSTDKKPLGQDNLEIVFTPDSKLYDGRFANNGWLQEMPDFLTKLTWDNAALIAPSTAKALNIQHEELIKITLNGRELEIAAYVMPGQASNSIAIALGYGRTNAGRVGNQAGFATHTLRTSDAMNFGTGATITKAFQKYPLACTQDHYAIDTIGLQERLRRIPELIRETDISHLGEEEQSHSEEHHDAPELWKQFEYTKNKWGITIDLNCCTGCNACVTACQAENNIPVVGKEQVINSREMHWLRIDRYFKGGEDNPQVAHQPVACMQCELAPCEEVCPVAATVHTAEGLNAMVYNRCVGTRYCSNNCPYKVRRFNFFNYRKNLSETEKMVYNPEVTVRSRGVMEKCTFCVQRIEKVKIAAKNEKRPIEDGEIVPACGQVCPTQAITFGDLNDPNSRVAHKTADPRAYTMLDELNIKPGTAYLARVRNPNPKLVKSETKHERTHSDA